MATESYPPDLALAAARLRPRGAWVVADDDEPRLPFADDVFDLAHSTRFLLEAREPASPAE
ncbi:hypothetical protein [Nonomuraea sp. NPDC049309]|uniref:hypothetical protein n=1 Tax=Nonomuraea sp. NPDC049309 TaxID=3364350 RepID=UPI00371B65F9